MATEHFVIVGGGQAAVQAIQTLRQNKFDGRITLVGEENYLPYQRPPLSKKYLTGNLERDRLFLRPLTFYEKNCVSVELGIRAKQLDPDLRHLTLDDGRTLHYDRMLLATGSRVRRLGVPGADLLGIHYVRTMVDADAILSSMETGSRLVVVGAGYIGLEVAAISALRGLEVTILEAVDRVMARVVCPEVSQFYLDYHARANVEIRCNTVVSRFIGGERVEAVEISDRQRFPCDLVIVGIGVVPEVGLAADAGIACKNGILVDEFARTEDYKILAAGDCTNHPSRLLGKHVRLESVQNAIDQAKTASMTHLGMLEPYAVTPWFWSDQYDLKLQIAGLSEGHEQVVIRGTPSKSPFTVFYLRSGQLLAVNAINSPKDFLIGKKLISAKTPVHAELLADEKIDLTSLIDN
jgi:3-phenylpropionate/trans-cinnamate dioxygenase ferredoxin reductase subunit